MSAINPKRTERIRKLMDEARMVKISLIFLMTIIVSGCDPYYGVKRWIKIDHMINHSCIEKALSQVSEVQ